MTIYIAIARKVSGQEVFVKHDTDRAALQRSIQTTLITREDVERFDVHQVTASGITSEAIEQVIRDASTGWFACTCKGCAKLGYRQCMNCEQYVCNSHVKPDPRKFLDWLCPECWADEQAEIKRLVEDMAVSFIGYIGWMQITNEAGEITHFIDQQGKTVSLDWFKTQRRKWVASKLEDKQITPKLVAAYI